VFAALWPYLAKAAFSLLLTALEKAGVLNGIEAAAARDEHAFVGTIAHLKKYSQPSDFPNSSASSMEKR
jgi:hypothetical protein